MRRSRRPKSESEIAKKLSRCEMLVDCSPDVLAPALDARREELSFDLERRDVERRAFRCHLLEAGMIGVVAEA